MSFGGFGHARFDYLDFAAEARNRFHRWIYPGIPDVKGFCC